MSARSSVGLALLFLACGKSPKPEPTPDSSFARLQQRGETAMGVNQYTSQHIFEPLPDGGRIVLQREQEDSVGTETIRAHMRTIAAAFSSGDFAIPGFVHSTADCAGNCRYEQAPVGDHLRSTRFASRGRSGDNDHESEGDHRDPRFSGVSAHGSSGRHAHGVGVHAHP